MPNPSQPEQTTRNLRRNCLSYPEVIAQSISVIAPSTVPVLITALVYQKAGTGTWLSFLLGMCGLLFVSFNINQFARRSASPGSLYTYIVKGLGGTAGVLSGWALLFGYLVTGMSTLCGFAIIGQSLLGVDVILLFSMAVIASLFIAYKDIQLSAKMMLVFEGVSVVAILVLCLIVWISKGFAIDMDQVTLHGASASGILSGIVLVVFGFSGFESSTSLGDEAKDPLKTIPRSMIQGTVISGVFFIATAYIMVLGFKGTGLDFGQDPTPMNTLASSNKVNLLGLLIDVGALLSFFSCTLACINSTARIIFSMARHGLFHDALGEAHEANETPYMAVVFSSLITFLIPTGVYLWGMDASDAQNNFGNLCSFGFIVAYVLVSIAAPFYLFKMGKLRIVDVVYSVVAVGFMMLPAIGTIGIPGSDLFPMPQSNILVWIFLGYMLIGLCWLLFKKIRSPELIRSMKSTIDEIHVKFGDIKNVP